MTEMTPLYDAAETAARIKAARRMHRENILRFRKMRGVAEAELSVAESTVLLRSAIAVMGGVWYEWLQSPSARPAPTAEERELARAAMGRPLIVGLATTWHVLNLQNTPYGVIEPYCATLIEREVALEHRFEERLDNGQQWLTADQRHCYDYAMPHILRRSTKRMPRSHLFAPGIAEAVWSVYDYMARMLGEHHAHTGRTVTPAEFELMAHMARQEMITGAYKDGAENVDRAHFDILARSAFDYKYDDKGILTAIGRCPIDAAELAEARSNPAVQAVYEKQIETDASTGCPLALIRIKGAQAADGQKRPNNYVAYLVQETLDAVRTAVFNPIADDTRLFLPLTVDDVTAVPNGKGWPKHKTAAVDTLES